MLSKGATLFIVVVSYQTLHRTVPEVQQDIARERFGQGPFVQASEIGATLPELGLDSVDALKVIAHAAGIPCDIAESGPLVRFPL